MKDIHPSVIDLQSRMFVNRLRVADVFRQAKINPSTWTRWAAGASPNVARIDKISTAIDDLIAEKEQAHGPQAD